MGWGQTKKARKVSSILEGFYWWLRLIKNPARLQYVINLSDSLMGAGSAHDYDLYISSVKRDSKAVSAFEHRLRLGTVDLKQLEELPANTLGAAYAQFIKTHELHPEDLPVKSDASDIEYLSAHLFETHDIWHVIAGFEPDIPGELGLQAFYLGQFPSTSAYFLLAAGLLNAVIFPSKDREHRIESISRGWMMGKRATKLFGTDWNQFWQRDLNQLRRELRIEMPSETSFVPVTSNVVV